ncbi:hypothetical protein [Salinibacter grassmerensis]|uniref:hypothetical protein n=1 Tax=Salinibacter grassmerensis TaxID=3040353 RepID=UPI0021E95454|nr:hypothetical protein [Salinibacter grassmerensis]
MAYGTKYSSTWQNKNSGSCEIKIQKQGYSGSVYDLTPTGSPFEITWSQKEKNDLSVPLHVSTAVLRFYGDDNGEALSEESFDAPDKEYRVQFYVEGDLYWQGYLATDLRRDNPYTDKEVVKLEAIDGLALLENAELNLSGKTNLFEVLRRLVRGAQDLNIAANMEWYAYRSGNQIGGDTLPLKLYKVDEQAFDELEPIEGEDGEYRTTEENNARTILEAVLDRFGMQLFQNTSGDWVLRQRHRIAGDGSIKVWDGVSDVANNNPTQKDLTNDLSIKLQKDKPRSGVRRLRLSKSVYLYEKLGELIQNGGFEEDLTGWSVNEKCDGAGQSEVCSTVSIESYNNLPGDISQENQQAVLLEQDLEPGGVNPSEPPELMQTVPATIRDPGPRGAIRCNWEFAKRIISTEAKFKLSVGDYYAKRKTANVKSKALPADNGEVFIDKLPESDEIIIPNGTKLQVYNPSENPDFNSPIATIDLKKPAKGEDGVLKGKISEEIPEGAKVQYYTWTTSETEFSPPKRIPNSDFNIQNQQLILPVRTISGDKVTGQPYFYAKVELSVGSDQKVLLDNISLKVTVDDEVINSTSYTALDDQTGREEEIKQLIGDGPKVGHPKAIKFSGVDITNDWKEGPYSSGESPSGKSIEEFTAKHRMREQRDSLERLTHEVELRDGADISPEDVFDINGKLYTVSYLRRQFNGQRGDRAEVELTRLKDSGTAGLEQAFYEMQSGGGSSRGGSGGAGSGGSVGEGSGIWDEITNKPSDLFARNGDNDTYTSTVGLNNDDIDSAATDLTLNDLDVRNALLEINTAASEESATENGTVRDVDISANRFNSPNALIRWDETNDQWVAGTEGSLRRIAGAINVDIGNDGEVDINGLSTLKTDNDPQGVFSKVGSTTNLLADLAPLSFKAEDETISGLKTHTSRVVLDDTTLRTQGAATGFSSSGTVIDDQESWFEDLQVRGSLIAREFELRKITVTKGDRVFGPGGGKVESVSGSGPYTLTFAEPTGVQTTDICLIQESDLGSGDRTIIKQLELTVNSTSNRTKTVEVSVSNSTSEKPEKGDDLVVVGSSDTSRDSSVFLSPYGPFIDTLDGINSHADFNNRQPRARFGNVSGMPNIDGITPQDHGIWSDNAYLKGVVVAEDGIIQDSVTVGGTEAQNLADQSYVDSAETDAETAAFNYADGLDDSVRTDLNGILDDSLKNGTTVISGGVIDTDLVVLDSVAFSPVETDSVIGSINASTEGININASKLKINSNTTFTDGFDPSENTTTIRNDTQPSSRDNGDSLQKGDVWIDTNDGDAQYTYTGSGFKQSYTRIDGGDIVTGTVDANRIDTTQLFSLDLNIDGTFTLNTGKIVTGDGGFKIDDNGVSMQTGSFGYNQIAWYGDLPNQNNFHGYVRGQSEYYTGSFHSNLRVKAEDRLELTSEAEDVYIQPGPNGNVSVQESDFIIQGGALANLYEFNSNAYIDIQGRGKNSSEPPAPPSGKGRLYAKRSGSDGVLLFFKQPNGNVDQVNYE